MRRTHWLSLAVGLGFVCVLGWLVLVTARFPPRPLPIPAVLLTSTPLMHSASVPFSPVAPPLSATTSLTVSRALTVAQAIIASEWLTFTDLEAGYSIRYPATFILRSGKSKGQIYGTTRIIINLPTVSHQEIDIEVEPNPDNLSIDAFVQMLYEKLRNKPLQVKAADALERMMVDGLPAYKTTILPGWADFEILVPYNKKVYRLVLVYGVAGVESAPEAKASFFQMLDTFQIKKLEQ